VNPVRPPVAGWVGVRYGPDPEGCSLVTGSLGRPGRFFTRRPEGPEGAEAVQPPTRTEHALWKERLRRSIFSHRPGSVSSLPQALRVLRCFG
jgi:hypothetical protein